MTTPAPPPSSSGVRRRAWRVVVGFGLVSLFADVVADGARSVYGPLLASLGASAVLVGLITGAAEATSLVFRVIFGPLADRTGRHWSLTILGYLATAVCLPLLAVAPFAAGAGLLLAVVLIVGERFGKAVRSPSKTALLAEAAGAVGRGRGFGLHKAMDQFGALTGPLLVAAVVAATGRLWLALALLAVPGAVAMAVLVALRTEVTGPGPAPVATRGGSGSADTSVLNRWWRGVSGAGLPRQFFLFAACAGLTTAGLVTYAVISFYLTRAGVVSLAAIPLIFAASQAAAAVVSVITGQAYDRVGPWVLIVVPVLVTAVPPLAFTRTAWVAVIGVLCWGSANGLQDSTIKALVADLVPAARRATAYGVFAAIQGAAAVAGGTLAGYLYERSLPTLIGVVAATQVVAALLLVATIRSSRHPAGPATYR